MDCSGLLDYKHEQACAYTALRLKLSTTWKGRQEKVLQDQCILVVDSRLMGFEDGLKCCRNGRRDGSRDVGI